MSPRGRGPVELLLVGFEEGAQLRGEVLAELERLAERDIVRLLDLLVVRKEADGMISVVEADEQGSVAAVLTGLHGDEGDGGAAEPAAAAVEDADVWYAADAIPPGTTAAIALVEHRWAIGLRDALQGAGGALLADEWVHPLDLEAVGL
jgi:hypothetical protein